MVKVILQKILKIFNNYEKWGAINMRPMRPIWGAYWGAKWGASEILPNMTYMIINHLKQSAAMSFEYIQETNDMGFFADNR